MYIMKERSGLIVNTDFVEKIFLTDTNDSTLICVCFSQKEQPFALERYKTREEALDAISSLFAAIETGENAFYI